MLISYVSASLLAGLGLKIGINFGQFGIKYSLLGVLNHVNFSY